MRLSTFLLLGTAALATGAYVWCDKTQREAETRVRVLQAQLEPLGTLRYEGLRAWPWGRGTLRAPQLLLTDAVAERLGLRAGATLKADRIEVLEHRAHDARTPELLRLRWSGLRWPLPDDALSASQPALLAGLARLRELGPAELPIDGQLQLQYLHDERVLRLQLQAEPVGLASLSLELSLRSGPEIFAGVLDTVELSRAQLDYRDRGLRAQLRQSPTLRDAIGSVDERHSLAAWTARESESRALPWPAEERRLLLDFLHEPQALRLKLDPPGRLQLRNLRLYTPADLLQVLGVELSAPPPEPST